MKTQNQEQEINLYALDDFTKAYIEAALWSSTDNSDETGGSPLDANYGPEDIAQETLRTMVEDSNAFQEANARLWGGLAGYSDAHAGHDFWLTRNWHGAGFWDRGLGAVGKELTDAAHSYGSVYLYVGNDGKIYG